MMIYYQVSSFACTFLLVFSLMFLPLGIYIFILGTYQALFVFHIDCALDLGMVSTADLVKYANGDMKDDSEFVIKTTL